MWEALDGVETDVFLSAAVLFIGALVLSLVRIFQWQITRRETNERRIHGSY